MDTDASTAEYIKAGTIDCDEYRIANDMNLPARNILFGPKMTSPEELAAVYEQNAYLKSRIDDLNKQIKMLMISQSEYQEKIESQEVEIANLHIEICQRDIMLCNLRFDLFKTQHSK